MSNLLEKASIITTPTAYSEGVLHSVKPSESPYADFTFTRNDAGTRVNASGNIESVGVDLPRIDYRGGSGSLLLEPASTNLVIGSAEGNYGNAPASSTNTISPDGTNNAFIPIPNEEADRYQETIPAGTYSNGQKLTYSWYRKRISTPTGISRTGDLDIKGLENLTELETSNATQIESNVNGFDRFQAVVEIIDGSLESIFRAYFGNVVEVGNSSVAYFGHQFEALPYATSYIPTTSGTQTRGADLATNAGSSDLINSTEGVLYAEISALANDGTYRILSLNDSSINKDNRVYIQYTDVDNTLSAVVKSVDGTTRVNKVVVLTDSTEFHKVAFKYKANDFSLWINGTEYVGTPVNGGGVPSGLNRLSFDDGLANNFYGNVKCVAVFKEALTDAELTCLTTI